MKTILAKFKCDGVDPYPTEGERTQETVTLRAVVDGSDENKSFSKWTPFGELKIAITNPDAFGFFKPGKSYYLDMQEA